MMKSISLKNSIVFLFLIFFSNFSAQDVNLNNLGWVRIYETYELNDSPIIDMKIVIWGKFTNQTLDDIIMTKYGTSNTADTYASTYNHNLSFITPHPNVTLLDNSIVPGRRLSIGNTTSPTEISRIVILFDNGNIDSNALYFNNTDLGEGGNPLNIPTIWQGKLGFHTREQATTSSVTQPTMTAIWQPNSQNNASILENINPTNSWDSNNDGNITIAEWKTELNNLGYVGIVNVYNTMQTNGDTSEFDPTLTGINTIALSDTDIVPITNYAYFVTIEDNNGLAISSGYGAWITGSNTLSTNDIENTKNSFSVYPNPTFNELFLNVKDIKNVKVFSMDGKLMKVNSLENKVNVENLTNGVYLIQITYKNGKTETQKFVKE